MNRSPQKPTQPVTDKPTALGNFFAPRSVAVIGASDKPGSVGKAVLENLTAFSGAVFPVNPKRATVLGRPAYASVKQIPEPVDLAVIVTPATTVPALIRECGEAGCRNAVIISAGFKERGAAGIALEQAVLAEARKFEMRIIGPNCLGVMTPRLGFNATFAAATARPGHVAFLSQSGALCTAILDWSFRENVGFSAFVSVGSMLDVDWGDLIQHLGDDPHTRSIVCYMESVGDARSFLTAAREVAYTKPIIVIKVGHTEAAAKAAASHTGAMTGSDAVLDAAFRRAGVTRVNTIGELFNLAELLAKQPHPPGPRLAIVTNAGGPGALATDMLVTSGGQLAELTPATLTALNELLPEHWSHGNPVDVLGDADATKYQRALELVLRDPGTDGALVILTPQAMTDAAATADALAQTAPVANKPLLASWMGGQSLDPARRALDRANIPTYDYPDTAARAFALMWRYRDNLRSIYETPALPHPGENSIHRERVRHLIQHVLDAGRTLLTEAESKQLLAAYGIPTVATHAAKTLPAAVAAAEKLGYPVVLKLLSETITHKTDVGGVQLNLADAAAVEAAWKRIEQNVITAKGREHFQGATVQQMIRRHGQELILGCSPDPQFGPVLLFGAGGELVEVFQDRALALPPLNATLARRLMEGTRIFKALQGVRGRAPVDLAALCDLITRFSQLVVEFPRIAELDINPLLAGPEQLLALDARVVLHPANIPDDALPRPAIRPYPHAYVTRENLRDGTAITLRPIRAEDEPAMIEFHRHLSERSVYQRFFAAIPLAERAAHQRLARLCFADYDREITLVAEHTAHGHREILAAGRLIKAHARPDAEFGLLVADAWQGRGLGTLLLGRLVEIARAEKLRTLSGVVLAANTRMLQLCHDLGFQVDNPPDSDERHVRLQL